MAELTITPERAQLMRLSLLLAKACRGAGIAGWTRDLAEDLPAAELWFQLFVAPYLEQQREVPVPEAGESLASWLERISGAGGSGQSEHAARRRSQQ